MRLTATLFAASVLIPASSYSAEVGLGQLKKGQVVHDFRVESVYVNDSGAPLGARFIHTPSGFTLDYLQIESVPQGYTWVNSIPVGDQGEPHTQEHLLLGKGTTGRAFAGLDTMWLSSSTAFTQQWQTSYHFNTSAGPDVFFDLFAAELNALLHPNYTDEEIRREVRHFGVTTGDDGSLRLEEKGSVYNEMTSSSANRYRVLYRTVGQLVYGPRHPLSYNSGGEPSGIRTMQPQDIRDFHAANYYLGNMGTMVSFPSSVPLQDVLRRTDAILDRVEPESTGRPSTTAKPFPAPDAAVPGTIRIAEFPHQNDQQPGPIALVWPATRDLSPEEYILLSLFTDTFAGDATTNLYKMFVDSRTKVMDTGATAVFSQVSEELGNPLVIILDNVAVANMQPEKLAEIRSKVAAELERVASLEDGSAELKEFNERVMSRVIENERDLARFVNSPPGWGARGTGSAWLDQLSLLAETADFRKSVTLAPQLEAIREKLAGNANLWRDALRRWKITGVTPYVVAARPSRALLAQEEAERLARAEAEAKRIAAAYEMEDVQAALARYQKEYDEESARIEALAAGIERPKFVTNPPMTLDEQLSFESKQLKAGVPLVQSNFDNMSSTTIGIALDATNVKSDHLRYLSLLPVLMTRVGVIEDGKAVSFEEMSERLRREILGLNAYFSTNPRTGRVELTARASGIGEEEARRALEWLNLVLHHPDWRPENLPRIRDVVDQTLSGLRNTMQGSEESWVNNPAVAYRMQNDPVFLAADSFLTRAHNALRLRWLLKEMPAAESETLKAYFAQLATAAKERNREQLAELIEADSPEGLSPAAAAIVDDLHEDLELTLLEIPDSSLARDWSYLVSALAADLTVAPETALAQLDASRKSLLHRDSARMFSVGSTTSHKALAPRVEALASSLSEQPAPSPARRSVPLIDLRLREREPNAKDPLWVGLIAPNMKGGVITTSVPAAHFSDSNDREKQLDYLASRLHSGYGAHGVFLKTLAAGLAYSNGLRGNVQSGRVGYYAERTPEIPQTVGFVVETLKNASVDPQLADYTIAQVFGESRAAGTYEARAEGMAADLADGQTPAQVRAFRQSILELRKDPELGEKLFERKDRVYARMIPGYAPGQDPDGVYFVIGADRQLDAWARYLRSTESENAQLWRLFPRDFWQ